MATQKLKNCDVESPAKDDRSFIRNCLSAPFRVASGGSRVLVMLDDVHETAAIDGISMLMAEIADIFSRPAAAFVIAGRRRFSVPGLPIRKFEMNDLDGAASSEFISQIANSSGVMITDQTRDLIATQSGGRPGFIASLFS